MSDYQDAYDAVLARWPVAVEKLELASEFGTTRVNACGPADAPPLVLLPGGFATSTVWSGNVAALSAAHRVYAVDVISDQGRSVASGTPVTSPATLMTWLDTVFDGLGLGEGGAAVCGHSYGSWIALRYALHAPERVSRLALLDPTQCFAGFRPGFLVRSLPSLLHPTPRRVLANLARETSGAQLDPAWLALQAAGAGVPRSVGVAGRAPKAEELRALTMPVLVLLAGRSKVHDVGRVEAKARETIRNLTVRTLPDATHFTLFGPYTQDVNRELVAFSG